MTKAPELLNNPFCGLCGQPMDAAERASQATETSVDMALSLVDQITKAREEGRQAGLREAAECADKTSTCILPSGHFLSKRVGDAIRALSGDSHE